VEILRDCLKAILVALYQNTSPDTISVPTGFESRCFALAQLADETDEGMNGFLVKGVAPCWHAGGAPYGQSAQLNG
ncbi:uncharacterized protein METZ01_LOCUS367148, partial [marine metagenome]